MKSETLTAILKNDLKATADDRRWTLPAGTRITVFLATPIALFPVGKVTALTLGESYITLESDEGRIYTDQSEIAAIRVDQEASSRESKLGFGN